MVSQWRTHMACMRTTCTNGLAVVLSILCADLCKDATWLGYLYCKQALTGERARHSNDGLVWIGLKI